MVVYASKPSVVGLINFKVVTNMKYAGKQS